MKIIWKVLGGAPSSVAVQFHVELPVGYVLEGDLSSVFNPLLIYLKTQLDHRDVFFNGCPDVERLVSGPGLRGLRKEGHMGQQRCREDGTNCRCHLLGDHFYYFGNGLGLSEFRD